MRKWILTASLTLLLATVLMLGAAPRLIEAQTSQDAITLASMHPAFSAALAERAGWTAAAYNTGTSYGIWRVQFWDASGEDLGWADVSVDRAKVYSWETHYSATESQRVQAEDTLRQFIAASPEIIELIPNPLEHDIWIDYNGWEETWTAWIEAGADSLYVMIQSQSGDPLSLDNLRLKRIYLGNVPTYDEWLQASQAQVTALAFQQPEIAAAVRDQEGWTSDASLTDEVSNLWAVNFMAGDQLLATATVDLSAGSVVEFNIAGM